MPKVAPADEAEARARLLPQSHGDVAAFARTASRWLARNDLEGTKIGAAHAHLVKAEHAELVKATVLERRAPEPESLVGSLELHETLEGDFYVEGERLEQVRRHVYTHSPSMSTRVYKCQFLRRSGSSRCEATYIHTHLQ